MVIRGDSWISLGKRNRFFRWTWGGWKWEQGELGQEGRMGRESMGIGEFLGDEVENWCCGNFLEPMK